MVRFVDLRGNDIGESFAFWNTVPDMFFMFGNNHAWSCIGDFRDDYESSGPHSDIHHLERFLRLIPGWVPEEYLSEEGSVEGAE